MLPTARNRDKLATSTDEALIVDLLIQSNDPGNRMKEEILGGTKIDAMQGLNLAMSTDPLWIEADVLLNDGGSICFTVPVHDVEAALVLKVAAWQSRGAEKDLHDILSLLEIAHLHRIDLTFWGLDNAKIATMGSRRDSAGKYAYLVRMFRVSGTDLPGAGYAGTRNWRTA